MDCDDCGLRAGAKQYVPGDGPVPCRIMFVGRDPGAQEDRKGKPFIGPAGHKFQVLLGVAGLKREEVYVTNLVKYRPPGNRKPKVKEIRACAQHLSEEMRRVRPEVIISMGDDAMKWFDPKLQLRKDHGLVQAVNMEIPLAGPKAYHYATLIPMYHPAAALHNPNLMPILVQDFQRLGAYLGTTDSAPPSINSGTANCGGAFSPEVVEGFCDEHTEKGKVGAQTVEAPEASISMGDGKKGGGSGERSETLVTISEADRIIVEYTPEVWVPPNIEESFPVVITSPSVGFDLETTSPQRGGKSAIHDWEIIGFSTCSDGASPQYFHFKPVKMNAHTIAVCHNSKFEYIQLAKEGIKLENFHDTKVAAYLLGYPSTHLKHLTSQLLNRDVITYSEVTQGRDMSELTEAEIAPYAAADAKNALDLWHILEPELHRMKMWGLYKDVEMPLVPVLGDMERRGVLVDRGQATKVQGLFYTDMLGARFRAKQAGVAIDISSHDQLGQWLDEMGAPCQMRTEVKRLPKTDMLNITWLKSQGFMPEAMQAILNFKEAQKLRSFPEAFLKFRYEDGALRSSFNQCGHGEETTDSSNEGARFGRISSSGPNLQQIPHHGRNKGKEYEAKGKLIRQCLVARPGYLFVAADVGQQEPRITALVAPEPTLAADLLIGSPYGAVGEAIYGKPITKADEHEWHTAKTFFLALTYGAEWDKLLEIDPRMVETQARAGYARATERYPGLGPFRDRVKLEARQNGYIRDYFSRIRYIPGVFSVDKRQREAAYREAINFLIQAPAATMIKIMMRRLWEATQEMEAYLVIQIHDEVILEVREDLVEPVCALIRRSLDGLMPIEFPIEIKVGPNLGDLEKI